MKLLIILALTFGLSAHAKWETVKIPGAICGDGLPYSIFMKKGLSNKLVVELMGGGVCWNQSTCWGPDFRNWIHPLPKLPAYSYLTGGKRSPVAAYTQIYFPYCNGDVWMGNHDVKYDSILSPRTYHYGRRNIENALEYLKSTHLVNFSELDSLLLFGSSAGAIGSLMHADTFDKYVPQYTKRLLFADSPGLHFGPTFWDKFSDKMRSDFKKSFNEAGLVFNPRDGLVAPQMKELCERRHNWTIGFVQTTRDIIMSKVFGNISQDDHAALVLGPQGIRNTLNGVVNCPTHVVDSWGHVLMTIPKVLETSTDIDSKLPLKEFVDQLIWKHL